MLFWLDGTPLWHRLRCGDGRSKLGWIGGITRWSGLSMAELTVATLQQCKITLAPATQLRRSGLSTACLGCQSESIQPITAQGCDRQLKKKTELWARSVKACEREASKLAIAKIPSAKPAYKSLVLKAQLCNLVLSLFSYELDLSYKIVF